MVNSGMSGLLGVMRTYKSSSNAIVAVIVTPSHRLRNKPQSHCYRRYDDT